MVDVARCLDAQYALRNLLAARPHIGDSTDTMPAILGQWIAMVRRAAKDAPAGRSLQLDAALSGQSEAALSEDLPLFLNAVHLKYALRGYMQQHGLV